MINDQIDKIFKSFKFNFTSQDILEKNGNQYLNIDYDGFYFIRNFCESSSHIDIDDYYSDEEIVSFNKNILKNSKNLRSSINLNKYSHYNSSILIGSSYKKDKNITLNDSDLIIGIDSSLKNYWKYINIYLCSNPYPSSMKFISNKISKWPDGVFSYKVYPDFLSFFKGTKMSFNLPIFEKSNGLMNIHRHHYSLEDHRSPALSAINFLFLIGIKKIIFSGIEHYLKEEKPGSYRISKNIYMYPQQIMETSIISAAAFWLKKNNIEVFIDNKDFDFIDHIKPLNI